MIRAAVLSASDQFHRDLRQHAGDAGVRIELSLRRPSELRSDGGLDVIIAHQPSEGDVEAIRAIVDTLPIVAAGGTGILPAQLQNQDGWGIVPDDDIPGVAAAARAAALGLAVVSGGDRDPDFDEAEDMLLTAGERAARGRDSRALIALTPRESEVLGLVAEGATNQAIALELGISGNTVKYHLGSLYAKLGVTRRSELLFEAIRRGLITI